MCCGDDEELDLPAAVIEMLARYRALKDEHGWDWGGEEIVMFRWARFGRLGDVFAAFAEHGDWGRAVRTVVGLDPPAGIVLVRVTDGGADVRCGPPRPVMAGATVPLDVVIDRPDGVDVETIDAGPDSATVTVGGTAIAIDAALRVVPAARLRLRSPRCARWSVTDDTGGAWFPAGVPHKWDVNDRPFFHAADIELDVPSAELTVVCARGLEFGFVTRSLIPEGETVVEADPPRLFDPAASGWYGGDLHVHLNYSGDQVRTPADAARMQRGEGLHLLSLVAGNFQTARVYDRELLEAYAGQDLPWSAGDTVARMGVEYRNDLLGHVHALGPGSAPDRYFTGHERSDHPEDWPPNHIACADLRHRHATVGYAHPVWSPFDDQGAFFANPRSVEARELVVDAALGLVDSLDVLSPFNDEAAIHLYHRLLSCGLRLTATAGTDTFLSFAHGPGTASNPPGWARVYAHLDGKPLSVAAFQDAIRVGRTVVTNGPWLSLTVGGHPPGTVLNARPGERLDVAASVIGDCRLTLEGPDGVLLEGAGRLEGAVTVDGPTWLAAVARGPAGPATLDSAALAHTTPVYVDVDGARVARTEAAEWCLGLIDGLATLIEDHGRFDPADRSLRLAQYRALLDRGRQFYRKVSS